MHGSADSRHPLVGLVDELARLGGRLKSTFAEARKTAGLNDSEMMVLTAVVEADRLPTVPQIGRSMGHPRQLVQRAANTLIAAGLVETAPNPDHKRAVLLRATKSGLALKRQVDAKADAVAAELSSKVDLDAATAATQALRTVRRQLEQRLRGREE